MKRDRLSAKDSGAAPARSKPGGRPLGRVGRVLIVLAMALAMFLAPALRGITLVADQSAGATAAGRAADKVAAEEAYRLTTSE